MKATHTGRLKYISEILSSVGDEGASKSFIDYILRNENKERELTSFGNCDTRFFDGEMCVIDEYFTDLREIKPEIEIPKTPFWILKGGVYKVSSNGYSEYFLYDKRGCKIAGKVEKHTVQEFINNGTWTICDAPEKVMIPWSDEDWKEWFLNDGVVLTCNKKILCRVGSFNPYSAIKFGRINKIWVEKDYFTEMYCDRHGNKFEKEA